MQAVAVDSPDQIAFKQPTIHRDKFVFDFEIVSLVGMDPIPDPNFVHLFVARGA